MVEEEEEGGPFCNELMCGEWLHGGRNHLEITQLLFRLELLLYLFQIKKKKIRAKKKKQHFKMLSAVMLKQILIFLIFSIFQKINQSVSIFQKINKSVVKMLSRSARAETRQSSKREVKKVMLNEDKVIFSLPVFNLFHPFLFYTKGGTLGEAMDSDPKHNDEAIQVGAGVPRLGQGGEEQEQDGRAKAEEALHRPVCGHQLSGKLECGRGLQYVHRLHCERLYGWTHTDYN